MIDDIVQKFLTTDAAKNAAQELTGKGIPPAQARSAVEATARCAATEIDNAGGASALKARGAGGLGDLFGGLGGVLGGKSGAGGATATAGVVEKVAMFVAEKTGLSPEHARLAVEVVLPKIVSMIGGK